MQRHRDRKVEMARKGKPGKVVGEEPGEISSGSQVMEGLECLTEEFQVYPRGYGSHGWFMRKRMAGSALRKGDLM